MPLSTVRLGYIKQLSPQFISFSSMSPYLFCLNTAIIVMSLMAPSKFGPNIQLQKHLSGLCSGDHLFYSSLAGLTVHCPSNRSLSLGKMSEPGFWSAYLMLPFPTPTEILPTFPGLLFSQENHPATTPPLLYSSNNPLLLGSLSFPCYFNQCYYNKCGFRIHHGGFLLKSV